MTSRLTRLIENAPGRLWHGYHVSAVDDTKVHRSGTHVWGTCTFHEYTARCPNRATTVRAHNWVVCGALLDYPDKPAWFLPISGRLYFRQSQLPAQPVGTQPFRTKCELAVALIREQAQIVGGRHLGVFDGGYALGNVVRPLVRPEVGAPRIDFLTRLRHDARLYALPPKERPKGKRGPKPKWGKRLAPPRQGGRWAGPWHVGFAFIYGRRRRICWKEVVCLWRVLGSEVPVKAIVARVEGYKKRFTLVTSALDLTGLQMVELFGSRFRQEDEFRDLKQRRAGRSAGRGPRTRSSGPVSAMGDAESAAVGAVPARCRRGGGLVVPATLEQGQGSPERAGPGATDAAPPGGSSRFLSEWLGSEEKVA